MSPQDHIQSGVFLPRAFSEISTAVEVHNGYLNHFPPYAYKRHKKFLF